MRNGYYFFTSERASKPCICQLVDGNWFPTAEEGPVTLKALNARGWDLGERVPGQDGDWDEPTEFTDMSASCTPLHEITIGENAVSMSGTGRITMKSRGETVTDVPMREALLYLMLTQSMSAAVEGARRANLMDDTVTVEYVKRTPHGPEATRLPVSALPDWAQELYR